MNNITGPRKLAKEEHSKTRKLWEEIFTEDTKEFLDYYYSVKTLENEIYVMEDGDKIISMLHLNPYDIRVNNKIYKTHYIVAVATDEHYRKRGYMAALLNHAMQVMKDRGEPFTFLMPASEAIYKPFGFEFIYTQSRVKVFGKRLDDVSLKIIKAEEKDSKEIAEFANDFLGKYDVVNYRNASYYETLLKEYTSENGGILVARREGKIVGVLCYAKEEQYMCMEPLFYKETELQHAIFTLTGNETDKVLCMGYGNEKSKPIIMAKILEPTFQVDLKNAKVFLNEVV
ncbi:MAG: GNAT family N-acetyltransferase [Tyzzerella sp.]|nr:GNAT family N-acetyltransferase [Tyzzerella sp.]